MVAKRAPEDVVLMVATRAPEDVILMVAKRPEDPLLFHAVSTCLCERRDPKAGPPLAPLASG